MRVISQKGMPVMTDIPYEKVVISQSMIEPNKIVAWDFFGGEDNIILMAEYSTPEKAEKAMQKLRECYLGIHVVEKLNDTVDCNSLSQIGIYKKNENGDYAYKLPAGKKYSVSHRMMNCDGTTLNRKSRHKQPSHNVNVGISG